MVTPGGDGTPSMREYAIPELAMVRETHPATTRDPQCRTAQQAPHKVAHRVIPGADHHPHATRRASKTMS